MSALTQRARGEYCAVRLPGCLSSTETVVAAHYRALRFGAGVGHKPPDWLIAFACESCHSIIDSRKFIHDHSRDRVRLAHAEGVLETIGRLIDMGLIQVNSSK